MKRILRKISSIKYCLFSKLETINDCRKINLKWVTNIHGDMINILDCRSIWSDEYGYYYRCSELLKLLKKRSYLINIY